MLSLQPVINIKILLSYYIYIICSVIIFLMCTKSLKSIFSMYSPSHFGFITTFRMPSHMWLVAVMLDKCDCNRCMWEGDTPQTQSNIQTEDFTGGPVVKTSPCNAGVQVQSQDGRAKIPHAFWPKNRNIIQKQYCNKFNKDFKNGPPKVLNKKNTSQLWTNFPGDPVVKNLPANAGDMGSIPGLGRFQMPGGS